MKRYLYELPKVGEQDKIAIYIPFSGGFDSTCLLLDLLSQVKDNYNRYSFNLISVDSCFTEYKTYRESKAREDIINYIKRDYSKIKIQYSGINLHYLENHPLQPHVEGMVLQQIYTLFTTLDIDLSYSDKCYMYLSFICGDQITAYEKEIKEICYNCLKIQYTKISMEELKRRVIIEFPYKTIYKEEILKYLIMNERKALDYCMTCISLDENDNNCGECIPCRALLTALVNIYIDPTETDQYIKDTAYEILKSRFDFNWDIEIKKKPKKEKVIPDTIEETRKVYNSYGYDNSITSLLE